MNNNKDPLVHFVLVNTTHAGNIGAAARAIKTMGFSSLRLVQPCHYLTNESLARASGADDLVRAATVYPTLAEAISDCTMVFGTSARDRSLEWSCMTLRDAATSMARHELQSGQACALVFGRERSGLSNAELSLCNRRLWIPSNEEFSSLNLGSAVQVVAYELRSAILDSVGVFRVADKAAAESGQPADSAAMELFFAHLEQTLIDISFLDPENPRLLMRRLRRYFGRNRPVGSELGILRGILTAVQKSRNHR